MKKKPKRRYHDDIERSTVDAYHSHIIIYEETKMNNNNNNNNNIENKMSSTYVHGFLSIA